MMMMMTGTSPPVSIISSTRGANGARKKCVTLANTAGAAAAPASDLGWQLRPSSWSPHDEMTHGTKVLSGESMLCRMPGAQNLAWACQAVAAGPDFDYLLGTSVIQGSEG